jgi:hypothetical protein
MGPKRVRDYDDNVCGKSYELHGKTVCQGKSLKRDYVDCAIRAEMGC